MDKKNNRPDERLQAIGKRLKDIRKSLNLTLDDIYKRTGISRSYISEFEKGKKLPTSKYLKYLIDEHHVNLNYIFIGTGEMFIPDHEVQPEIYNFGKFEEEIKDLLFHITNIPNALYEVLGHFSEYKVEKEKLIKNHLVKIGKLKDDR